MRLATLDDLPELVEMAGKFVAAAQFGVPFDPDYTAQHFKLMIDHDLGCVFRTDAGFICGSLAPFSFNSGHLQAVETAWWSEDRRGSDLLQAFEHWALRAGARSTVMICLPHLDGARVERKLRTRGYEPYETILAKVIA